METPATISSINKLLREAFAKTDLRDYEGALTSIEAANILEPDNIYLDALKRQLAQMFQLDKDGELDEATRHELIDPMPGIIECALKESKKLHESRRTQSHVRPSKPEPSPEPKHTEAQPGQEVEPSLEESTAQKELEGLKLLYFQRASKFVMNGDYEAALAEVQRVFEVDPNNTIAREYASKVENLLRHARTLASPPDSPSQAPVAPSIPPTADDPGARDSQRVTAWTESFGQRSTAPPEKDPAVVRAPASRPVTKPSPQRTAATPPASARQSSTPSHRANVPVPSDRRRSVQPSQRRPSAEARQAVIYGNELSDVLSVAPQPQGPTVEPAKSSKGKVWGLLIFAVIALGAVSSYFVFGSGKSVSTQHAAPALEPSAAATMSEHPAEPPAQATGSAPEQSAPAQVQDMTPVSHDATPVSEAPVRVTPSAPRPKVEPEMAVPRAPRTGTPVTVRPAVSAPDKSAPLALKAVQTDAAPAVPDFIPVEKDPAIVKLVRPSYPAFLTGDGQVVVKVLIDAEGKPVQTKILKSTNSALDMAAVDAVMKSQYSPAQMGQGPVAAWLTIPFKFKQAR